MPIEIRKIDCESHTLHHWNVNDVDTLASLIAHILLGQFKHAEKILAAETGPAPGYQSRNIDEAIARVDLRGVQKDDPRVFHRDGWLFQFISWMVCIKHERPAFVKAPQARPADKGFDGIFIRVKDSVIASIAVSEDKATDNPRATVLDEVWSEFRDFETGKRDNELTSEIIALLDGRSGIDMNSVVGSTAWLNTKHYRASVATSSVNMPKEIDMFKGYENVIPGDLERRSANLFLNNDMRQFFDDLSTRIIKILETLRPA